MSENLDRVCEWADAHVSSPDDAQIISALRAEFAELERKAEENQRKACMIDGLWKWLNGYKATTDFGQGIMAGAVVDGELLFRWKVVAKLDSLAKGGRDDQA